VYPNTSHTTDLVIDINGYFAPPATGGLSLHVLAECRVLDTCDSGTGGPISDGERTVGIAASYCRPPGTAQAYVLNVSALPTDDLGYLVSWADGETQPETSTLNAPDGADASNMAIVQNLGDGDIDVYTNGTTNLLLDIGGYFAP
jgi:hypothetical protein